MNLLIIEAGEMAPDGTVALTDGRSLHLRRVLHVTPDQEIRVGLLDGPLGTARVLAVVDDVVRLACDFESATPPPPRVDVLLALPRPKVMQRLWAQLAALGVGQIILTNAERVERDYFGTHVLDEATYRPLLIEGLQQARDTRLPVVSIHRRFKVLIEDHLDGLFSGARLVADPSAEPRLDAADIRTAERVLVAIGPEGGWNAFELGLLTAHGFQPVRMSARTLRTDTACIALLAVIHHAIGSGDAGLLLHP
jgi:RsmE family RNA methyltransferase